MNRHVRTGLLPTVLMLLLVGYPAIAKDKEKRLFTFVIPEVELAADYGSFGGSTRIVLGEVVDDSFGESPNSLGWYYLSRVDGSSSRTETVEQTVGAFLLDAGLRPSSADGADYTIDVIIRRNRLFRTPARGGLRLRVETFLEFVVRQENAVVARVLACGNAEDMRKQHGRKARVLAASLRGVYQHALDDAIRKLTESDRWSELLGEEWTGAPRPSAPDYLARIDRDRDYGPSIGVAVHQGQGFKDTKGLARLETALRGRRYDRIVIEDFEILDREFRKKRPSEVERASRCLPGLIREHLRAFYPKAFTEVELGGNATAEGTLVISGEFHRFRMGQLKNGSDGVIHFTDGATGEELFSLYTVTFTPGHGLFTPGLIPAAIMASKQASRERRAEEIEGWWHQRNPATFVREKEDDLARDLAFALVTALKGSYTYPDDPEVRFDGRPYAAAAIAR